MSQTINETRWILTLLTLMLIHLKLSGAIDWAWHWVFAPAWIPAAIFVAVLVPVAIVGLFARALRNARRH